MKSMSFPLPSGIEQGDCWKWIDEKQTMLNVAGLIKVSVTFVAPNSVSVVGPDEDFDRAVKILSGQK